MQIQKSMDYMMSRIHLALALLTAAAVAHTGCGGPSNSVWVTGKLLKGGAVYVPPKDQDVYVTFVGLEIKDESGKAIPGGEPFWADVDQESGTFSVPGNDGRGIPPGKYRVAVTQKMSRHALNSAKLRSKNGLSRETDMLDNRFGLDSSPIVRELKSSCELAIDLDHPTE
jgi:hypothetical protein